MKSFLNFIQNKKEKPGVTSNISINTRNMARNRVNEDLIQEPSVIIDNFEELNIIEHDYMNKDNNTQINKGTIINTINNNDNNKGFYSKIDKFESLSNTNIKNTSNNCDLKINTNLSNTKLNNNTYTKQSQKINNPFKNKVNKIKKLTSTNIKEKDQSFVLINDFLDVSNKNCHSDNNNNAISTIKKDKISMNEVNTIKNNNYNNNNNSNNIKNTLIEINSKETDKNNIDSHINDKENSIKYSLNDSFNKNSFVIISKKNFIYSRKDWLDYINNSKNFQYDYKRIYFSLYHGIDEDLRERLWLKISGVEVKQANYKKDYYKGLLQIRNKEIENEINKDINRTALEVNSNKAKNISSNFDSNTIKMKNILLAYANSNTDIGYCQGMSFLVILILSVIENEEKAFWFFCFLLNDKNWRSIFSKDMRGLKSHINRFKHILKDYLKDLYEHLNKHELLDSFIGLFNNYFMTLFSYQVPLDFTYKVWDIFLFENNIVSLILTKLMALKKDTIMSINNHDELYIYFRKNFVKDCIKDFGILTCFMKLVYD